MTHYDEKYAYESRENPASYAVIAQADIGIAVVNLGFGTAVNALWELVTQSARHHYVVTLVPVSKEAAKRIMQSYGFELPKHNMAILQPTHPIFTVLADTRKAS